MRFRAQVRGALAVAVWKRDVQALAEAIAEAELVGIAVAPERSFLEDLLDEEHIRKTIDQVEKATTTPKNKKESGRLPVNGEDSALGDEHGEGEGPEHSKADNFSPPLDMVPIN